VGTLIRLLEGRPTARDWCDDRTTPAIETCGQMMALAFDRALAELDRRFGADRRKWRWGEAHYADGLHEPFGRLPLVGNFFNVRVPSGGGPFTLNRGQTGRASPEPFASRGATTFRAVYDLADLDASKFIQSTGQSGNPFSSHYRSFAHRWSTGDYIEIPTRRAAVERQAAGRWHLAP
jgi:penicillin amidase